MAQPPSSCSTGSLNPFLAVNGTCKFTLLIKIKGWLIPGLSCFKICPHAPQLLAQLWFTAYGNTMNNSLNALSLDSQLNSQSHLINKGTSMNTL